MQQILDACAAALTRLGQPAIIIACTVKGKGLSFMAGDFEWHARVPTAEELAEALRDLGVAGGADLAGE